MIPILYRSNEQDFTSNGIGRLSDCISCYVTEERNGIYECEFEYPITGIHYDAIQEGNYVVTSHDEQKDRQPFVIYRISRPINGKVTVNAHHVSYYLSSVIVGPFAATSATDALSKLSTNALTDNPFTFWTDKASAGTMTNAVPTPAKSLLGGKDGSILDSFGGGEYKFDWYTVKLYAHRGNDNGVTIRYGKNLTDLKAERDTLGIYNAVIPYWTDGNGNTIYGRMVEASGGVLRENIWTDENGTPITDENDNEITFRYYLRQITTMDLSSKFNDKPTAAQLETMAASILTSNQPWLPKDNIKVDFVALWQTEEYKNIALLERVQLCDTVSVYYPELGVDVKTKVIKVKWDALLERYSSIELGVPQTSFADVIEAATDEKLTEYPNISMMDYAIEHATDLITGGLGGNVVFMYDADGKPTEMLVMDTEDTATAVNVLRINVNGIGFSSNGINGPYTTAWTLDGSFVADFITAGHLSCNRIQGGTLTLGGAGNGNGVMEVYDASSNLIGQFDKDGITFPYPNGYTRMNNNGYLFNYMNTDVYQSYQQYANPPFNPVNMNVGRMIFRVQKSSTEFWSCEIDPTGILAGHWVNGFGKQSATCKLGEISVRDYDTGHSVYLNPYTDAYTINGSSIALQGSSAKRYKHNITDKISDDLDPHKLYDLTMKQFVFNRGVPLQYEDMAGKTIPGFIAEDIEQIYPAALIRDRDGRVENWDERRIIPGMLKLIQEQHDEIEELKERIEKLEAMIGG